MAQNVIEYAFPNGHEKRKAENTVALEVAGLIFEN
jgi:hypothetical protein